VLVEIARACVLSFRPMKLYKTNPHPDSLQCFLFELSHVHGELGREEVQSVLAN